MRLNKRINKRKFKRVSLILIALVLLIIVYLNTYLLIKFNVLPMKYFVIYVVGALILPLILIFLTCFKRLKKIIKIIFVTLEILYIIVLIIVFFYLNKTFNFIDDFTKQYDYETKTYYVLVLKDSKYNKIEDLANTEIGYEEKLETNMDSVIKKLKSKVKINAEQYESFTKIIDDLNNKKITSMLIEESFYKIFSENDELGGNNPLSNTKILYQFAIREKIKDLEKDVDVTKDTFNVYISGIDTYGDVTDKTRSDVNIVMNVNPKTHKILMINIPRDYYVELDGVNKKDKLTHAGIYGVEMSMKTLEKLLDIEINYYVKVNYNALIKLVDALDGVEVYSKYNFSSYEYHFRFKEGYNHVNGKQALDFVRTRKAFLEGDRQRGENQQAMISAIIKKASSSAILVKYDDILKSVEGNFATNITTDKIMSLVKMQLDSMPNWEIESISLNGQDSYAYTYTYPSQELYVMIPDQDTILSAQGILKSNMN